MNFQKNLKRGVMRKSVQLAKKYKVSDKTLNKYLQDMQVKLQKKQPAHSGAKW